MTRALIEPMVKDRYGRILFFVGDGSISARGSGRTHLSAAKMGLIGMARGLASEFAFVRRSSMAKEWSDHAWLAMLVASCLIAAVLLIVALVAPDHLDVLRRHGW